MQNARKKKNINIVKKVKPRVFKTKRTILLDLIIDAANIYG